MEILLTETFLKLYKLFRKVHIVNKTPVNDGATCFVKMEPISVIYWTVGVFIGFVNRLSRQDSEKCMVLYDSESDKL